jgi:hypothetical protein
MASLFHYTNFNGLIGILQSQSLWAADFRSLNDKWELTIFGKHLKGYLKNHKDVKKYFYEKQSYPQYKKKIEYYGGQKKIIDDVFSHIIEIVYKAHNMTGETFLTSFCNEHAEKRINENGLLSQWRGYGDDGGFAIEFDKEKLIKMYHELKNIHHITALVSEDVVYSNNIKNFTEKFKNNLSNTEEFFIKYMKKNLEGGDFNDCDTNEMYEEFLKCAPFYKHWGFKEENEYRFTTYIPKKNSEENENKTIMPIKYRNRVEEMVSYIDLFGNGKMVELEYIRDEDITLPIKRIIVGPHKNKMNRKEKLELMLRNTKIEIHASEIPYEK